MRLEYLLSGVVQTTRRAKNDNDTYLLKENPEDEAISGSAESFAVTDRISVGGSVGQFNLKLWPAGKRIQSRSSAWLEHYTDNVGVSSSNLDGTTANFAVKFSLTNRWLKIENWQ